MSAEKETSVEVGSMQEIDIEYSISSTHAAQECCAHLIDTGWSVKMTVEIRQHSNYVVRIVGSRPTPLPQERAEPSPTPAEPLQGAEAPLTKGE